MFFTYIRGIEEGIKHGSHDPAGPESSPSRFLMMECRWAGRLRCVETGSGNVRCRRRHHRRVVGTYAPFQRYRIYSSGHRGPLLRRPAPRGRVRVPPSPSFLSSWDDEFVRPMPMPRSARHVKPRRRLREVKSLPRRWSFGSSTTSSPTSNERTVQFSLSLSLLRASKGHRTTASRDIGVSWAPGLSRQRGRAIRSYGLNRIYVVCPARNDNAKKI